MKKNVLAVLMAMALTATLAACFGSSGNDIPKPQNDTAAASVGLSSDPVRPKPVVEKEQEKVKKHSDGSAYKAVFVTQSMSNPSQNFSWNEFKRLMGNYGFDMIQISGESEPQVEVAGIEQAIAEGFDAIFCNPSDPNAAIPALKRAREAGIVVGMFSSLLPDGNDDAFDFFVGSDDYLGGILAGEFVSARFPNGANFVEVGGQAGHDAQVKRAAGFRAGIAPNIIELDSQNCPGGWNGHEALSIMEDFLVRHGDNIDIVWCHWDNGASSVIEAIEAAGMTANADNGIFVIGVDGNSTGYKQVLDGVQALSVGQSFTKMAEKSLENAKKMLEGATVDRINIIPMDMVTTDNVLKLQWPDW